MPQFTLYSHTGGPNGWKVQAVLYELGLTDVDVKFLNFQKGEHKAPEHTKYNPNGRIPTLVDHSNGDFALWESNAIIEYLVNQYDKDHKISYSHSDVKASAIVSQWLYFQASGQGVPFGQAVWFNKFHPEQVESAKKRYEDESKRVLTVLEGELANKTWIAGDKPTVADFSFFWWNLTLTSFLPDKVQLSEFPNVQRWHNAIAERPAFKRAVEERTKAMSG